jgi:hypothetical protein
MWDKIKYWFMFCIFSIVAVWLIFKKQTKIVYKDDIDDKLEKLKKKKVGKKHFSDMARADVVSFIKRKLK